MAEILTARTCENCAAFRNFTYAGGSNRGECRRRSPSRDPHSGEGGWPSTGRLAWCAEHLEKNES